MSGGWGGIGSGVAAKVYVKAAAGLVQLAGGNGGYAWDGVSYDPDGLVAPYGADPALAFDPAAVVFKRLPDGLYRLSAMIWPVGSAASWDGVIRGAGDALTGLGDVDVTAAYAAGIHMTNSALPSAYAPSLFEWEGRVTEVDDGSLLGLYTALAIAPDKIAQGSWLAIRQIG